MKGIVTASFALAVALLPREAIAQRTAVAFVSMQRIVNEAVGAKAAAKRIEDLRRAKTQEVQAKEKALTETRLQLANAGGLFSSRRRAELQQQEKRQITEWQQSAVQAQNEVQKLQAEVQNQMRRDLASILDSMARSRGVQLVLNSDSAVVWSSVGVDLTAEVLKALDAKTNAEVAKATKTDAHK